MNPVFDYRLKDFFIGRNDGKSEATYKKDFENYFYDYKNLYEKALDQEKYIVLGRKGTGKTILSEFIDKKAKENPNWFCALSSHKDFRFDSLIPLENRDITPNEFISIWEWIILIQFAGLIQKDQSLSLISPDIARQVEILLKFVSGNFGPAQLNNPNYIVEKTKRNQIKGNLGFVEGKIEEEAKEATKGYLSFLESLRETVGNILQTSCNKYILMFDELDDRFRDQDLYKSSITSLIKAVHKINQGFGKAGVDAKAIIFLRSDIYMLLNDPDLNKIRMDHAVEIDWERKTTQSSPIFSLIFLRIKKSVPALASLEDSTLYQILFPEIIRKDTDAARYILERTFFRPRDVITYLNLIVEQFPGKQVFGKSEIQALERKYSEYFLDEIKNELIGHLSAPEIKQGLLLLKQFNKQIFHYEEINAYFEKNLSSYKDIRLKHILSVFFQFGILGNRWLVKKEEYFYSFTHRDPNLLLDFDKEIVLHLGFRKSLTL